MGRSHFSPADGPLMLRRVLEDPADDAPRLAYADWLEESGQEERAEFIRIQCRWPDQIARVEYCRGNAVGSPLIEWPDSMTSIVGHQNYDSRWQRGFISEIRLTCEQFVGGPCPTCLNYDCSGTHSHAGRAGQVIHGVLHETDPRRQHHHHDERCKFNCKTCSGTGRIEGLARSIFEEHPVMRVMLTDKRPTSLGNDQGERGSDPWRGWFAWGTDQLVIPGQDGEFYGDLPDVVFAHLQGGRRIPTNPFTVYYPNQDEAFADESAACVAYGRSLANLPPLPTTH